MILTHRGVSLTISNPLGHAFDLFDPLGDALRILMFFNLLRVILSFVCIFEFSFALSTFWCPLGRSFLIFFFFFLVLNYT